MSLLKVTKDLIRVSERNLRFVGTPLPTELTDTIQLVHEMRAIRPWEEFDEKIIRWSLLVNVVAGGAGIFSGGMITLEPITRNGPITPGTLIQIDEVHNLTGTLLFLSIGSAAAGLISVTPADFTDARWGPQTAIPPVRAVTGGNAAISGQEIRRVIGNERLVSPGMFIGQALNVLEPLGSDQTLTIWSSIANILMTVMVQGKIMLGR